jgi:hypothetical protein
MKDYDQGTVWLTGFCRYHSSTDAIIVERISCCVDEPKAFQRIVFIDILDGVTEVDGIGSIASSVSLIFIVNIFSLASRKGWILGTGENTSLSCRLLSS